MYVEGFVTAVPKSKKSEYEVLVKKITPVFMKLGATKVMDCWQENVPHGKITDFFRAVQASPEEDIVFSYIEFPNKTIADEAMEKMESDPEMQELSKNMPFDGKRVIFGGFESIQ